MRQVIVYPTTENTTYTTVTILSSYTILATDTAIQQDKRPSSISTSLWSLEDAIKPGYPF